MYVPARRVVLRSIAPVAVACFLIVTAVAFAPPDAFDELYTRGQKVNASLKTLTARFIETSTSTLLTKPIVARGTLSAERPSRVVLRYTDPDMRVVLIDGNTMTMSWPSRSIRQVTDIHTAQGRVQKYFVNSTAAELRSQFDIQDRSETADHPGTYHLTMVPKRKQIREALARLDLWVDRSSLLLDGMKMTFANGDTKLMSFDQVVANPTIAPETFMLER